MNPASADGPRTQVEHIWGTAISLDVRESTPSGPVDAAFAWFRRVDDLFSTWRAESEVSRLGRGELALADTSPEVRTVLRACERIRIESRGAFDVRFGADARVAAREGFGPIDPSGYVKGWALQRAADQLRVAGIRSFTINAGGDVITAGNPDGGGPWRIGVRHPWQPDRVAMVLGVNDLGVATSGRYERGDHIIDPRTGSPATGLMSVTVVDEDLGLADAYATAALVMGPEGLAWLADHRIAAATISDAGVLTTTRWFREHRIDEPE